MTTLRSLAIGTAAASGLLAFGAHAQAATVFSADLTAEQSTTGPEEADVSGAASLDLVQADDGSYSLSMSVLFSDGIDFSAIVGTEPGQIADVSGEADFDEEDVDATRLHIHNAVRGVAGPVVFGIFDIVAPGAVADANGDTSLTYNEDGTTTLTTVWDSQEGTGDATLAQYVDQLLATLPDEDTAFYFNLHTVGAPPGLIRGQLVGANDLGADVVPLPAAAALFVPALAAGGFLRRRQKAAA